MISMLKSLPERDLIEIFWKTIVESEGFPLSDEEKEEIQKAKIEHEKGETIKWEDLK